MKYDKLIRDKIPDIINTNNQKCSYRQLSCEEFLKYAEMKLDEELLEYHQDKTIEELVDILEVIKSIAEAQNIEWDDLVNIMIKKREKRGGFSQRILLESVD